MGEECENISYHHGRDFNYTATGKLGDKRCSMLKNELHQRAQLARQKSRGFDMPEKSFTYGIKTEKVESVQDAMTWNCNTKPPNGMNRPQTSFSKLSDAKSRSESRDFINLNRAAVKAGLTSSHEISQFRDTHEFSRSNSRQNAGRTRSVPPTTHVFGLTSRPSTPIADVLSYRFQEDWVDNQSRIVNSRCMSQRSARRNGGPGGTRASQLKTYVVPMEELPLWKMPKFENKAQPRLNSFRSENSRRLAMKNHLSDKTSRSGVFGHGIYAA